MQPGQQLPGAEHSPSPAAQHVQQQPQQADSLEAAAAWLISCSHTWIRTSRFVLYASGGVVLVCWCVMYLSVAAPLHTLARHIVCATPVHPNSSNTHTHRAKARPPSTFCAQGCPCCLQVTLATTPAGESSGRASHWWFLFVRPALRAAECKEVKPCRPPSVIVPAVAAPQRNMYIPSHTHTNLQHRLHMALSEAFAAEHDWVSYRTCSKNVPQQQHHHHPTSIAVQFCDRGVCRRCRFPILLCCPPCCPPLHHTTPHHRLTCHLAPPTNNPHALLLFHRLSQLRQQQQHPQHSLTLLPTPLHHQLMLPH